MEALFGPELISKNGKVPTSEALQSATAVGVYFSAHWCGPCRGFTPELSEGYKLLKETKGFEIVFVSSDREEKEFEEYYAEMPWLALPYDKRDLKSALSKKFKVQGIPTLVILDKTGSVITLDGREAFGEDPKGNNFPWHPPSFHDSIGTEFVTPEGTPVSFDALKGKVLGLYFSAHWCPPCKMFTPALAATYKKVQAARPGEFEIVFVSSDHDESQFKSYHHEMPWLAIPFHLRDRKTKLSQKYSIQGIPSLVIVNADTGAVINPNARGALSADTDGLNFPWSPPIVRDLANPDGINDVASIVIFAESMDKESQQKLKSDVAVLATRLNQEAEANGQDKPFLFFISSTNSPIAARVKTLVKLDESTNSHLVLLDIQSEEYSVHQGDVNIETVSQFVANAQENKLTRKNLGE